MVAYLTDTGFWLQWVIKRGFVSLKGNNNFLTPLYDWIYNFIQE